MGKGAAAVEFTFGEVEAVLAYINNIADYKRVAFGGRLKILQKNGVPLRRAKPGRGKAGSFTFTQLMQMAAAVELLQTGLSPQRAARIVADSWHVMSDTVYYSVAPDLVPRAEDRPFWVMSQAELKDLTRTSYLSVDTNYIFTASREYLSEYMTNEFWVKHGRRAVVINGQGLTNTLVERVCDRFGFTDRDGIKTAIQAEMQEESDQARAVTEALGGGPFFYNLDAATAAEIKKNIEGPHCQALLRNAQYPASGARKILSRLSLPTQVLLNHIAIRLWGDPSIDTARREETGGVPLLKDHPNLCFDLKQQFDELIHHGLFTQEERFTYPTLTTLGVEATIGRCMGCLERLNNKETRTTGEQADVSSEA